MWQPILATGPKLASSGVCVINNFNSISLPQLQHTLGVLCISFALAFLMNIGVESPIAHLDNFIFKKLMGRIIGEPQTHKEAEVNKSHINK